MTWGLFWQIVLIATLALFSLTAVLVTVLGARDIKRLVRELKKGRED